MVKSKTFWGWLLIGLAVLILGWKLVSWVLNWNLIVVLLLLVAGIILIKSRKSKK